MKLRNILLAPAVLFGTWALADNFVTITFTDGTTTEEKVDPAKETLTFSQTLDSLIFSNGNRYAFSNIDHIGFRYEDNTVTPDPSDEATTIYVDWNGNNAPTIKSSADCVTAEVSGADVTITNTNTDTEYTYVLSGNSDAGSFTLVSGYKSTVRLNGLDLKSTNEEALNIKCGKRVALELVDGTTNNLADATVDNGQKGALYCKGHLEISGAGTLNLTGNVKHGLSSKEYLLIKKTAGTINVNSAANDGIHAGEYVQINGGNITVKNVKGDGIQAEMVTPDEGEVIEDNGKLIIKGGTIDVTTTSNDAAALKCDSTLHVKDGNIKLVCSGNGSKCMKSDLFIDIEGGTFNMKQSGGLYDDTSEPDPGTGGDKSYKVYVNVSSASKYWPSVELYKEDGTLVSALSSTSTVTVNGQNLTFYSYDFKQSDSGTYYFKSGTDYYSSYYSKTYSIISTTFTGPTSGEDIYYQMTSSNSIDDVNNVRTFTMNKVTPGSTAVSEGDLNSSHGIKGDGGVTISGGNITMNLSGTAAKGISSDNDIVVSGGTLDITNTGAGQSGTNTYTAKGITSDKNVYLTGGNISISMSGSGGKGVKADNNIIVGDQETGNGPTLSVKTSGSKLSTSGTSTGGGGGWGGGWGGESSGSSAKAMKCVGSYYQYGGDIYIETATDGAEGIESKTASTTSMNFNGGNLFMNVYDDCINSAGEINFAGANVICYSTGNDAIDSNYGRAGSVTISDGVVIAFSTRGGAEMGFDCDGMSYVKVTGGIGIAGGGSQGGSSSTMGTGSTHYKCWSASLAYTANNYYSIVVNGQNIVTWLQPVALTSSFNVYASDQFVSSATHTLYQGTTAPTSGTAINFHKAMNGDALPMIWKNSNITTGTSKTTFSPN